MESIQNDIKQFMVDASQEIPDRPTMPPKRIRKLRAELIMEEAIEQVQALGFDFEYGDDEVIYLKEMFHPRLTEIADGIADQVYVSVGTAIACGIDMGPIWKLVQAANMAKFGPGSWKDENGKQQKPKGWQSPNIAIELEIARQQNA